MRPTFTTGRGELIEAYLLDFDGDLYGSELRLDFLARLRGERRFARPRRWSSRCTATWSSTRERGSRRAVQAHDAASPCRALLPCATADDPDH